VIVTLLNQETLAAKHATTSIPIVMLLGVYPVQAGLVASLARSGGNVTGTTVAPLTGGKYLELLKGAIPKLTRVAILWDPTFPGLTDAAAQAQMEVEARTLGLTLASIEIHRLDDVERALGRIAKEPPGALLVVPGGPLPARAGQVIDFASRHGWPTIFPAREYVEAGGLMSYGYDREHLWKRAASYVDRILRGAKPGDLPVEQPTKFELVINLKTAKALGPDDPAFAPAAGGSGDRVSGSRKPTYPRRAPDPPKMPRKLLPENMARDAIAHEESAPGDKVRMTFRVVLSRAVLRRSPPEPSGT
jgi:ABC-type uncharacterized transport system substrate-binding protein